MIKRAAIGTVIGILSYQESISSSCRKCTPKLRPFSPLIPKQSTKSLKMWGILTNRWGMQTLTTWMKFWTWRPAWQARSQKKKRKANRQASLIFPVKTLYHRLKAKSQIRFQSIRKIQSKKWRNSKSKANFQKKSSTSRDPLLLQKWGNGVRSSTNSSRRTTSKPHDLFYLSIQYSW